MILRFILVSVLHQRPTFLCTKEAENGSIMTTEQKLLLTNGFAQLGQMQEISAANLFSSSVNGLTVH